ncbi:hypothetical protein BASA81_012799 [Batrachochytrium salamandrivorans]|nr:hypothetical protein BASA81_012799 [Batrachochytrium salamandrivorans]
MSNSTKTSTLSKRSTISVLREGFRKNFTLNKRKSAALSPQQAQQAQGQQGLLARRFGAASSKEQKYRYVLGWSSLYYECEDRLCNKYYLCDLNGTKTSKPPGKTCGVLVLSQGAIDARTDLLKQGLADCACEAVQLQILNENESIHLARKDAASLGARQVAGEDIHTIQDVLRVVNMSHHARTFQREGVDLATAFFLKDEDLEELGLKTGERIRLQLVLDYMRHIKVEMAVDSLAKMRTTRFIKGDQVEHLKESENLIRKGKIVGVHADDAASGVYYTVALDSERGYELQSAERKLEFPGVWETILRDQGIEPIFTEPGMEEEETVVPPPEHAPPLTPLSSPPPQRLGQEGTYDKYNRMKRAGLPEAAVINAMQRDGVPVPLGFFAEPASAPRPPSPPSFLDQTTDPFSFATIDEEEPVMTMIDDSPPRKSSLLSGMAPPPPIPPIPPYRSTAASLSELEILKAIDEQLTLEDSLNESLNAHRLRRMSSSITGLPPPPPAPHNDYFDSGMRLASLEPAMEEEDGFEFSGMASPPPPIPDQHYPNSTTTATTTAGSAQWEDEISFLNHSNLMPTMHEEPFDFEEEEEYIVQ